MVIEYEEIEFLWIVVFNMRDYIFICRIGLNLGMFNFEFYFVFNIFKVSYEVVIIVLLKKRRKLLSLY